jgi:hypothetical protein
LLLSAKVLSARARCKIKFDSNHLATAPFQLSAFLQIVLLAIHLFLCNTRLQIKNEGLLDAKECKEGSEARAVD